MSNRTSLILVVIIPLFVAGCGGGPAEIEKAPRPVSVILLDVSDPSRTDRVTGVVASWKTEQIGFEVAGRVESVIEPETNFEGKRRDADARGSIEPLVLARLDRTRYENNANSIRAQIETVKRQQKSLQIEINDVLSAQKDAAIADFDLAQIEVERNQQLVKENAAPLRALDRTKANMKTAEASIAQIDANVAVKMADMETLDAQIDELNQSLKDAQRDLADCELTLPFSGQVAKVHVIPGSYVERGEAVLTAQMMDPIKIEFEVSSQRSRTLKYKDLVDISFAPQDGPPIQRPTIVYMIDPVADHQTRTFTVTLLSRNQRIETPVPPELADTPLARTRDVWRLQQDDAIAGDSFLVESNAIQAEGDGHYVWKVTNWNAVTAKQTNVLHVQKVWVERGKKELPFLDLWTFAEVRIKEGEEFDPEMDVVAGQLELPDEAQSWEGDKILFEREQWLLRPGDLVGVDLSGVARRSGFYVPLDAIVEKSGSFYVFVAAETESGGHTAHRIAVTSHETIGTMQRIEAVADDELRSGLKVITGGVHFLVDGERINVAEEID